MMFQTLRPWLIGTLFALLVPSWIIATATAQSGPENEPPVTSRKAEKLRNSNPTPTLEIKGGNGF